MDKSMSPTEFYNKIGKEDKEAIINLDKKKGFDFIPTGSWVTNFLIGDGSNTNQPGGFPRGHVVEVLEMSHQGKQHWPSVPVNKPRNWAEYPYLLILKGLFINNMQSTWALI